jgi:hypothetical protein
LLSGHIRKIGIAVAAIVILAGCQNNSKHAPSIGEAFVGPAVLKIRADIPLESATVATVKHGDRLQILQHRRKFLRVRTAGGAEGWTDERQLLAPSDMANLKQLSQRAAKMPSQGVGTTFGDLRVHTQPSTQAPSFLLIKENEKFDVLAQVVLPRTDLARAPLIPPTPKKAKGAPKKPAKEPKVPPVPMPKPPPPPPNWLALSKTDLPPEEPPEEPDDAAATAVPVPTDNWSLIRIAGGQAGWVLTRMMRMSIPDEVAQYAEGHRIVSYFSLGELRDGDEKKNIWLWTTIGAAGPYDFDSFRVFVWSLKRHRYETAYIERNLQGYSPVLVHEVELSFGGKSKSAGTKYPGFSICVTGKDGQRRRREYALLATTVRYTGDRACEAPAPLDVGKAPAPLPGAQAPAVQTPPEPAKETLFQRLKRHVRALTGLR